MFALCCAHDEEDSSFGHSVKNAMVLVLLVCSSSLPFSSSLSEEVAEESNEKQ